MDISRINSISENQPVSSSLKTNKYSKMDISFKDIINSEVEKVNNKQIQADNLVESFIKGEVEDLHKVMIATEEARLSLELAVQVRNKLVESYKEINNMQI